MKARSLFSSMMRFKCPSCRKGDLFFKPWTFSTAYEMPDRCPECDQNYCPEPGFYFGAMFLSYIITAFLFLALALSCVFALKWSVGLTFFLLIIFAVVTHNYFFRFSRSLWIHLMVKKQVWKTFFSSISKVLPCNYCYYLGTSRPKQTRLSREPRPGYT